MAAREISSTRRRVLGAAVALPVLALAGVPARTGLAAPHPSREKQSSPSQALWNRRLARYRRLHARWHAEAEPGAFRRANNEYNRIRADLVARFGSWEGALKSRIGKPLCRAAFARVDAAEDVYYDRFTAPMHRAAIRLIVTPAPDLHALLTKLNVISELGLEDFETMPRPALDLVGEDLERFVTVLD